MTTYTKEYSDNSHVWMTPVAEYAPMMIAHGCTFADFEAKHPCLAKSEYGQDLEATLAHLSNRDSLVVVDEEFVQEDDTTEDTLDDLISRAKKHVAANLGDHVMTDDKYLTERGILLEALAKATEVEEIEGILLTMDWLAHCYRTGEKY